jgi:hypothetical protein
MISTCETMRPATEEVQQALPVQAPVQRPALETVLLEIRLDSLAEPERYIEEIDVPFGGE